MSKLGEVLLAKPRQRCPVNLGVSADVVVDAGLERCAGACLVPVLRVLVAVCHEDFGGRPVLVLARQKPAALEQQYVGAGVAEGPSGRGAAHSGADHDNVSVQCAVARGGDPGGSIAGHDGAPRWADLSIVSSASRNQ